MEVKVKHCLCCVLSGYDDAVGLYCDAPIPAKKMTGDVRTIPEDCPLRRGAVVVMLDEGLDSLDKQLKS